MEISEKFSGTLQKIKMSKSAHILLVASIVISCVFLFKIWSSSPLPQSLTENKPSARTGDYQVKTLQQLSFYNPIVERDPFSSTRGNMQQAQLSAVKPPSGMTLEGTALLSDKKIAIVSVAGQSGKPSIYSVGDNIKGFIISDIQEKKIVLEKGGLSTELTLLKEQLIGNIPESTENAIIGAKGYADGGTTVRPVIKPVKRKSRRMAPPPPPPSLRKILEDASQDSA